MFWCCLDGQSHFESSSGSSGECRLSAGWAPTLRPSQSTWAVSMPVYAAAIHIHYRHLLLLLNSKADTHFTVPWRIVGWANVGTAVKVRSPCQRLYIAVAVDKHNRPR